VGDEGELAQVPAGLLAEGLFVEEHDFILRVVDYGLDGAVPGTGELVDDVSEVAADAGS
jgi:hypothetical protein